MLKLVWLSLGFSFHFLNLYLCICEYNKVKVWLIEKSMDKIELHFFVLKQCNKLVHFINKNALKQFYFRANDLGNLCELNFPHTTHSSIYI